MLLFIIANALILKHVLTEEQIPQAIAGSMLDGRVRADHVPGHRQPHPADRRPVHGAFGPDRDRRPLVFPIAIELGIDPIHLGIIMVVNMEIGMITPPVGLNLFVTSGVTGMPMMRVVKAALPWLGIMFVFLILVTYIPWLSTVIPTALMGPEIITQ